MLGWAVSLYFKRKNWPIVSLGRKEFDIAQDKIEKLKKYIQKTEAIVNCTGIIKPRIADTSIEEILKVNALFPHSLARLANKYQKMCFHLGTDCVYSGQRGNYSENDFFDAQDIYGLTKAAGDTIDCMTLRTSLIGEERQNHYSLLEWVRAQKGKTINGFVNHHWNGVTTLHLAEIIETILSRGLYEKGIFHIFSPERLSKYKLISLINEVYCLKIKLRKVKAPKECNRTLSTIYPLCSQVAKKSLRQQLGEMKDFFENETT